jgi:hypothetical protein
MSISSDDKRECCFNERKHLLKALRKCDFCTTSYEEFHQCYRDAARKSGHRARGCLDSWLIFIDSPNEEKDSEAVADNGAWKIFAEPGADQ